MYILYDWEVSPLNSAFSVALSGGDMQVMQMSRFMESFDNVFELSSRVALIRNTGVVGDFF